MNVWLVVGVVNHHGDSALSVWSTASAAEAEAERLNERTDAVFDGGFEVRGPLTVDETMATSGLHDDGNRDED